MVSALEHTEAALAKDPSSFVGLFNRGIIAADLGLCRLAARTWRQYQNRDPGSPWAEEAGERLALLPCVSDEGARNPTPDELFTNAMETLLPRWIEVRLKGSATADRLGAEIGRAGEELQALAGDPMIRELTRELETVREPEHLAAIATYVEGRSLYEAERYEEARDKLRIAARTLRQRHSWLAPWADIWLSVIDVYGGRFTAAEGRMARLAHSPEIARSPYSLGKVFWIWGLAAARAGRLETGYDRLWRAEKEFERGRFSSGAASVRTLRAETMAHLGFTREAWRPRVLALRALQAARGRFSFFDNALLDGATFAQRTGAYAVADAFLEEAAEAAHSQGNAFVETEVLLWKAAALRQRGANAKASAELRRAFRSIRSLAPGLVRERFEKTAAVDLWSDPAYRDGDPAELQAAVAFFAEKGPRSLELKALRVKARRERRAGDPAAARRTLEKDAIKVIRRLQADIDAEEAGIRQLDSIQDLFDEAIDLAVEVNDPLRALGLLESARRGGTTDPASAGALSGLHLETLKDPAPQRDQPAVLVLCLTPTNFVWWRLEDRAVRWGRDEASRVETALRAVLDSVPSGRTTTAELGRLYEILLAKALQDLPPERPLVIVPDGLLQRVPFAALRNSETGVRLIEERAVSLRTSLRAARDKMATGRQQRRTAWRVIAVGDPAFDINRLPLSRLPGAAREAEEVASIYGSRSHRLVEGDATARAVREAVESGEVLHLAAHATVSADGFRDALALAADGEDSGLTAAAELLPNQPSLQLVVLSGCSTLGLRPSRSGGLLGLARVFVDRGIPAVLGTLWRIDDRLLPNLMADFHRLLLRGDSASEALRQAQLAYLAKNPEACCDWAALQLVGDLPAEPASIQ